MDKYLTPIEKQVLTMFFGIDQAYDKKIPVARIAEWFGKSEIWVKKKKAEALKKMQTDEVKEIITNFIEN